MSENNFDEFYNGNQPMDDSADTANNGCVPSALNNQEEIDLQAYSNTAEADTASDNFEADKAVEFESKNTHTAPDYIQQPAVQTRSEYADTQPVAYSTMSDAPKYNTYGTNHQVPPSGYYYPMQDSTPKKEKKQKKPIKIGAGALACTLAVTMVASAFLGFGGGMLANKLNKSASVGGNQLVINKVTPNATTASSDTADMTTAQITEMTADSVVEIVTETVKTSVFYQQYISSGAGSGVIISDSGYIVTNNHVINGASKITVTLRNGNSYEAELVGTDSEVDVALIKIKPNEELTVAQFGDSSTLRVGDKTVVIGNPLGQLGGTVTDGIVSALDRDVTIDGQTMSLLQTNAAINPGNSGGAMFSGQGELIGIVVAKSSGSEIEGLGFAIPINKVLDVLDDLMQYGYVRGRVSLGISMIDITTQQMAMMYGVSEFGCYISSVELNSNASRAGLQKGDRIIAINGTEIASSEEVVSFMKSASVGDTVEITVSRNGRTGTLSAVLEEDTPDETSSGSTPNEFPNNDNNENNGNDDYNSILDDFFNRFGF